MRSFPSFEHQKRGSPTASPSSFARPVRSLTPILTPSLQLLPLEGEVHLEQAYRFEHSLDRMSIFPPAYDPPTPSEGRQRADHTEHQQRSERNLSPASREPLAVQPVPAANRPRLEWNGAALSLFPDPAPLSFVKRGWSAPVVQRRKRGKAQTRPPKTKTTNLPDPLKIGVERLSGFSMDDIQIHYHSSKPAEVEALAYTQGAEIHLGPGQERYLGHEMWHVVQQKQGRVPPTLRRGSVVINDDESLEQEADLWGARAAPTLAKYDEKLTRMTSYGKSDVIQRAKAKKKRSASPEGKESDEEEVGKPIAIKMQKGEEEEGESNSGDEEDPPFFEENTSNKTKKRAAEAPLGISPAHPAPLSESPPQSPKLEKNAPKGNVELQGTVSGRTRKSSGKAEKISIDYKEKAWITEKLDAWQRRMMTKGGEDKKKRAKEYHQSTADARSFSELAWVLEMLNTGRICVALVLSIEQETNAATLHLYSNQVQKAKKSPKKPDLLSDLERVLSLIDDTQQSYQEQYEALFLKVVTGIGEGDRGKADEKGAEELKQESEKREQLARARIAHAIALLKKMSTLYASITPVMHRGRRKEKHAELRAVDAITQSSKKEKGGQTTLGISKLCCAKCLLALYAFQRSLGITEEQIFKNQAVFAIPGTHLTGYSSGQALADFLKSWDVIQYVFDTEKRPLVGEKKHLSQQDLREKGESNREFAGRLWNADPRGFLALVYKWVPGSSSYTSDLPSPDEPYYKEGGSSESERPGRPKKSKVVRKSSMQSVGSEESGGLGISGEGDFGLPEIMNEEDQMEEGAQQSFQSQMKEVAQQSFLEATSSLAPFLVAKNSSGMNDNCLIYSLTGALGKPQSEEKISDLGKVVRRDTDHYDKGTKYLYTEAIPTILEALGEDVCVIVVHGNPLENEENTFHAHIFNADVKRTIFIVNAAQIHFGFGMLQERYTFRINNNSSTVTFIQQ